MMKAFVAVVAGVVVWGITAFVLVEVLHAFWDMETAAVPVFIVNWVASIIGLILARETAEKIAPPDRRRHAITLAIVAGLLLITLAASPLGSMLTWATLGGLLACGVEWRTSNASFRSSRA